MFNNISSKYNDGKISLLNMISSSYRLLSAEHIEHIPSISNTVEIIYYFYYSFDIGLLLSWNTNSAAFALVISALFNAAGECKKLAD
jgi:hypothetical protein